MKKNIFWIAGLTLLLFVWTGTALAADKIGFINMQMIIQNSNAGQKAAEDFKKLFARKQENIKAMENEVKKLKDELDKQGAVMTAGARSDKEAAYQRKMRDYQILVDDTNKELQKRDQEYSQQLIPEILKVVRAERVISTRVSIRRMRRQRLWAVRPDQCHDRTRGSNG